MAAISNAVNIFCDIQRGDVVMLADAASTFTGNNPSFFAFDLTNPTSPSLIASTPVNKRFFGPPYYFYFGFRLPRRDHRSGRRLRLAGRHQFQRTRGARDGRTADARPREWWLVQCLRDHTVQHPARSRRVHDVAGRHNPDWNRSVVGGEHHEPVGDVDRNPSECAGDGPTLRGNTAVAIGDNGGWRSPICCGTDALTGNVVVEVFDLTNPQNPQLVANVTTTFLPADSAGRGAAVIGPHLFLYAAVMDVSSNNFLMLVDTTDPHNPVITTYPIVSPINVMKAVGPLLYAPTGNGLQIDSIPGLGAIQYTAAIQIAKSSTVAYNANSFSVPPTSTVPGVGFDTVTWVNPPSNTITWTSNVTGIQPGQVVPIDLGGTVSFTVPAGSVSIR